jgi:hypothetical protein
MWRVTVRDDKDIRHKGLKRLFEQDDPSGLNPEHVDKLRDILATLMPLLRLLTWIYLDSGCIRSKATGKAFGP